MPRSPVHVTPRAHEALSSNPWINASDKLGLTPDTVAGSSEVISIKASSSCYHSRSQTIDGDPLGSPSVSSNECQNVFKRRGSSLDLYETRPSLKRAISRNRKTFEGERSVDVIGETETTRTEAQVIVHQIQPGDSLPGVALKYNVSLATLRSTNKLWANDTIHLRQVLYIPIQAIGTAKAKSIPNSVLTHTEHPSYSLLSSTEVHTRTFPRIRRSSSDKNTNTDPETTVLHASAVPTISTGSPAIIKRVPLSELSFFPPSAASFLSLPKNTSLSTRVQSPLSLSSSNSAGTPPSLFPTLSIRGAPGLANLWNGAKEEIISRLSFDSTRGSSDASEEHDLELDVVRPHRRVAHQSSSTGSDPEEELIPQSDGTAIAMKNIREQDSVIFNTPRKPKMIRTTQLQPSPKMMIPARADIGRSMSIDK